MARAISAESPKRYVLEQDEQLDANDPSRTVFLLKPLTGRERAEAEAIEDQHERMSFVLKVALRGWERFLNEADEPVAFPGRDENASPAEQPYLKHLSFPIELELAAVALFGARLSRADEGKSDTPSGTPEAASTSSAAPAPSSDPE